jgi:hypothetical protein
MKARTSVRKATTEPLARARPFENVFEHEIESTVRQMMTQPPPARIYAVVSQSIRDRPETSQAQPLLIVFASGVAIAILLVVATAAALGPRSVQIDPASGPGFLSLTWISNTDLARWINESESIFAYPGILFLHTFGLALVVGFSLAVDARLLGIASRISAGSLRRLFPYIWIGFLINALSGLLLFIADIRRASSPLFEIKLALVALGVVSMTLIDRELSRAESHVFYETDRSRRSKFLGVASLVIWFGAITAGRLLAYIHSK